MEKPAITRRDWLALVAVSAVSAVSRARAQAVDPVCVIVAASSAQHDLSVGTLRRIFLHQPTDDVSGHRFIPLNLPAKTPVRTRFDELVLGFDPDEMARYWVDQRIRGTQAPRVIPTQDMLIRVLGKLPGSISYALASQLTSEVRALRIDGRRHTEHGYPLARR